VADATPRMTAPAANYSRTPRVVEYLRLEHSVKSSALSITSPLQQSKMPRSARVVVAPTGTIPNLLGIAWMRCCVGHCSSKPRESLVGPGTCKPPRETAKTPPKSDFSIFSSHDLRSDTLVGLSSLEVTKGAPGRATIL